MMIRQIVCDVFFYGGSKIGKCYGIKKYHISRKGTARLNPEFKRVRSLLDGEIENERSFDVGVDRLVK